MKILGYSSSTETESENVLNYALSLFEGCKTEIVDLDNSEFILSGVSMIVVLIDDLKYSKRILNAICKPGESNELGFFLICNTTDSETRELLMKPWLSADLDLWGDFSFQKDDIENSSITIVNTRQRLELIRKINQILFKRLELEDPNKFSCGIERSDDDLCDASDY